MSAWPRRRVAAGAFNFSFERWCRVNNSLVDLLPAAKPAPRGGRGKSTADKLALMACPVIEGCITGNPPSLRELADLCQDRVTNSVATVLGAGISGEGGANLYRDRHGSIRCVQENPILMARFARTADIEAMLARRGETAEEFAEAVAALPKAEG
jgi:hypothetical protein